jgi:hypothetical protein
MGLYKGQSSSWSTINPKDNRSQAANILRSLIINV